MARTSTRTVPAFISRPATRARSHLPVLGRVRDVCGEVAVLPCHAGMHVPDPLHHLRPAAGRAIGGSAVHARGRRSTRTCVTLAVVADPRVPARLRPMADHPMADHPMEDYSSPRDCWMRSGEEHGMGCALVADACLWRFRGKSSGRGLPARGRRSADPISICAGLSRFPERRRRGGGAGRAGGGGGA